MPENAPELEANIKLRRALHIRGLRQRWIVNTVAPIFVLLVVVVTLFSAGVASYYYSSLQKGLETRARSAANVFSDTQISSYPIITARR
jgi:hypothetical protein